MILIQNFPFFSIIACLVCAVVSFVVPHRVGRWITVCLLSVSTILQACVVWYCAVNNTGYTFMMGHYPAPWGNEIAAGVLEPAMATLFSFVILCCVLGGADHLRRDVNDQKKHLYWVMVDLTLVSLLALCYTNDLFTGYVFIEICTIASCGLLCIRESGRSLIASVRYMVFALVGSGLFLIGVIYTYSITGHLLFPQLYETIQTLWAEGTYRFSMTVAIGMMTTGLVIKIGLFPFHFWLPEAHGHATPATSGILSGVIIKGYFVLLLKIIYRVVGIEIFTATGIGNVLLLLGLGAMVVCSISAIYAKRLKVMVAYSSAAQIGYMFMGLGMGTQAALLAVLFQIVAHALTKPMLFLSSSQLADVSGGHQNFPALRGAAHRCIPAGILFTVGSLSMVGIPIFAGFIPKLYFAAEAFSLSWQRWPVLIALAISTVLNVLYFLYTALILWLPPEEKHHYHDHRASWFTALPALALCALNLAVGLHSAPLKALFEQGISLFCR